MNENEPFTLREVKETSPEIRTSAAAHSPRFGAGPLNLAIPDRGHIFGVKVREFANATELNNWATENPTALIVFFETMQNGGLVVVYGVLEDDTTREEKQMAAQWADQKLQEYRAQKAKAKENEENIAIAQRLEDDRLRSAGRRCLENHSVVDSGLKGRTKNQRKTIADEIIAWGSDSDSNTLTEIKTILKKYVKDGHE